MGICLRSLDVKKTGNALAHITGGAMPAANSVYQMENHEQISFSEFTTKIKIE